MQDRLLSKQAEEAVEKGDMAYCRWPRRGPCIHGRRAATSMALRMAVHARASSLKLGGLLAACARPRRVFTVQARSAKQSAAGEEVATPSTLVMHSLASCCSRSSCNYDQNDAMQEKPPPSTVCQNLQSSGTPHRMRSAHRPQPRQARPTRPHGCAPPASVGIPMFGRHK